MTKAELVKMLQETFQTVDYSGIGPDLVNFVDDEIHWDRIAELAATTIENCFDEVPWESQ